MATYANGSGENEKEQQREKKQQERLRKSDSRLSRRSLVIEAYNVL